MSNFESVTLPDAVQISEETSMCRRSRRKPLDDKNWDPLYMEVC